MRKIPKWLRLHDPGPPRMWRIGYALAACFLIALAGLVALWAVALVLLHHPALPRSHVISVHDTVGVAQLVFASVAGAGALVALVVAYRRQRVSEASSAQDRLRVFNERFIAIAAQLGDAQPAVRLAGVHAMAGLAEDWEENRQTCVDVLCAYLRLPYDSDPGDDAAPAERAAYRANREVRHTIIRLIGAHLREGVAWSWGGLNLDFTGVIFDGGDFTGARFFGDEVCFRDAVFSGGEVRFGGAEFSGGTADFSGAKFAGGTVSFDGAVFSSGEVDFSGAKFAGATVSFDDAVFSGSKVSFGRAGFSSREVSFNTAKFSSGTVSFGYAGFSGAEVSFFGAGFSGGTVSFGYAGFSGGTVSFGRAGFSGGTVSFDGAIFAGSKVSFRYAGFSGGEVSFLGAGFAGGTVTFGYAGFSGGTVSFLGAGFSGGTVTFGRAGFSGGEVSFDGAGFSGSKVSFDGAEFSAGTVDLRKPRVWSQPPEFDWAATDPPPAAVLLPASADARPGHKRGSAAPRQT